MQLPKIMQKYKRVILYYIVGFVNTAVDFLIYSLVLYLTRQAVFSQGFGYLSGVACSFCLNRGITFQDRKEGSPGKQILSFLSLNLISLGIGMAGISFLIKHSPMSPLLAKLPVTFATSVFNYFGYKLLVFRPKATEAPLSKAEGQTKWAEANSLWKTAADQTLPLFVPQRPDILAPPSDTKLLGDAFPPKGDKRGFPLRTFKIGGSRNDHRKSTGSHGI